MRNKTLKLLARAVVVVALALGMPAYSQLDTGTITGTVRDSSSAVLAGAEISVRSVSTNQAVELRSNYQGIYVSPPLRAGEYTVTVTAKGFESAAKRLQLDVSQRATVDFDLALGTLTQEVVVVDATPVLQTETSTLSNLRTEKAIKDLPLNGRNFAQLLQLSAGVMPAQTQTTGSPITMKRGVTGNSVNGTRLEENNYLVDGISNTENHNGLGILIFPSVDAIAEFRVEASVSDAQFGRGGGGTVNLIYKSGSKDFHGNLYEFLRNSALDAKNYFDRAGEPIPPFRQNQFGGTLGGPLLPWVKEKGTFFFFSYEGTRVRQAQTLISSVPTEAFRNGDFSAAPQRIFDPLTQRQTGPNQFTRDAFPGNRIPESRIDPVGRNLLNLFPLPNLGSGVANNFLFNPVRSITGNKFDFKVDQSFSQHDTAFVRYSTSSDDLQEPSFLPAPAIGNGPGVPGPAQQPVHQIVASETHIFTPVLTNEARAGWTRLNLRALNVNYGQYITEQAGVPGGNVPGDILTSGLSIFSISGLRDLGDNGFTPAVVVSDNLQFSDNVNYIQGKHSFKFGGDVQRRRYNAFQSDVPRGSMAFSGTYTQDPTSRTGTGLGPADALLGLPISGQIRYLTGTRGFRRTELGFYAQDIYKATQRLTLTLGLRYENFIGWPWTEVADRMYQFVPEKQDVVRVGTEGIPRSGARPDNNNLSPRVGLAYRFLPKTVFRAAYGMYYSAPQWDITRNLAANPPEFVVSSFANDQFDPVGARTVQQGFSRPELGTVQGTLRAIDIDARTPYTQQWNAAIQQELPSSLSLTVAYVGTKGTKLQGYTNTNQPVPGTGALAPRRPFSRFDTISTIQNRFDSSYHGLQLTAERRFSAGLAFQVAYTYSHAIDVTSQFGGVMDIRNIGLDRGNSDNDVRHRMVASWSYALPFHASGFARQIVEGWQFNGILSLYGGLPFTVTSSNNTLNIGSGTRTDRLREGSLPTDQRTVQRWFDTEAFAVPGTQLFGNSGRNILNGPGTKQLDCSLFKAFPFSPDGGRRVEFRAEAFNLTNTPQFNNPNGTFGAAGFGTITSAGAPLTLQRTSRQLQLALKLYF
jgi:outer membrane receptor protein involved in Fe transport